VHHNNFGTLMLRRRTHIKLFLFEEESVCYNYFGILVLHQRNTDDTSKDTH
jgi:hypothetical protein